MLARSFRNSSSAEKKRVGTPRRTSDRARAAACVVFPVPGRPVNTSQRLELPRVKRRRQPSQALHNGYSATLGICANRSNNAIRFARPPLQSGQGRAIFRQDSTSKTTPSPWHVAHSPLFVGGSNKAVEVEAVERRIASNVSANRVGSFFAIILHLPFF